MLLDGHLEPGQGVLGEAGPVPGPGEYSTVQYSTVQYCTVLCCTVQYSTVQYRFDVWAGQEDGINNGVTGASASNLTVVMHQG